MDISALYEIYLSHPSVQTDTRKLKQSDIFFALKGPNFNGNTFAARALQEGAAWAVVDEPEYATGERCFLVTDVLSALQQLARHHREQLQIPFIAITGSNGKTTTKELVTAVLRRRFKTCATEGNLNNHIGVPLTILSVGRDAEMAIVEMGANHLKEIESYCRIALPTHGIITNCGKAHIEGFGSEEGVRKGKGELYDFLREHQGTIFRNTDLPYLEEMAHGIADQVTYGSTNAKYIGRPLTQDVLLQVAVLSSGAETLIDTQLVGAYNFPNVMVAVAVGLHFGLPVDEIKEAVQHYHPDNSRSQWLQRGRNRVILDAYNANPTSMKAAIQNFAGLKLENKILWIGAMKEMGAAEAEEHRELVRLIGEYPWAQVVLVGKEFEAFKGAYPWFAGSSEAAAFIRTQPPVNASILIKGSRGSRMETLLEALP